jgi:hypothetical protein
MPRYKRPLISPGGVPALGRPYPSRHEGSLPRRLARPGAYVQMTRCDTGKGYVYRYEDGPRDPQRGRQ